MPYTERGKMKPSDENQLYSDKVESIEVLVSTSVVEEPAVSGTSAN